MDEDQRFDFAFGAESRATLLEQARSRVRGLSGSLGPGEAQASAVKAEAAARQLLDALQNEVAELATFPDVLPLRADDFVAHGMQVPSRFIDLSRTHRFYWVRIPITLQPAPDRPFVKLKCGIEFNPGSEPGHLRPVAHMILPDQRFQTLLKGDMSLKIGIGEDFEFRAAGESPPVQSRGLDVSAKAGVAATANAHAGISAGPFTYEVKKAQVSHSTTGTEKVFWTLDGAQFFQENEPVFVVVVKVPNETSQVRIAAALQAYHQFSWLASSIGSVLDYLGESLSKFFRAGAPAQDTKVWDLTPRL